MAIILWIIVGVVSGFAGAKLVGAHGRHVVACLARGLVGALAGGLSFRASGTSGTGGLGLDSTNLAILGACLVLAPYLWLEGRRLQS